MKKTITVFCMIMFLVDFGYAQTEVATIESAVELECDTNLGNIFKVLVFKNKYETVEYIHKFRGRFLLKYSLYQNDSFLNRSFKLIKGFPYYELLPDSMPIEVPGRVEHISKEDINKYLEQLNYTPDKALKDYKDFIQLIQLEKEDYMNCIDSELAKGEASEYAKDKIYNYDFRPPGSSLLPFQTEIITKLNFLKIFKEFILIKEEEVLPIFI